MNEHDIVAYGWEWAEGDAEPTEPVQWGAVYRAYLPAGVELSMHDETERLFLRLRNGQIIRVKLR